jgi:hypothetical protein
MIDCYAIISLIDNYLHSLKSEVFLSVTDFFQIEGVKTKYSNPEVAYLFSAFWNDRMDVTGTISCTATATATDVLIPARLPQGDRNIATFIDYLQELDPMIQLPEEYIFAGWRYSS